eukprot:TRINITY_DN29962_c0_g1_i2.p1 TRINITY_DN29962_c0_g1~~TRINITY_DN29962_c0_g1_i2.p1  ORF type:complete len:109 (+),score=7.94 TRINITY_DN29962_c0_g1_i2:77-403(+)
MTAGTPSSPTSRQFSFVSLKEILAAASRSKPSSHAKNMNDNNALRPSVQPRMTEMSARALLDCSDVPKHNRIDSVLQAEYYNTSPFPEMIAFHAMCHPKSSEVCYTQA